METWLDKYFGHLISILGSIFFILIGVIGWFLNQTMNNVDESFKQQNQVIMCEIKERKEVDMDLQKQIDGMIDNKVAYRDYFIMQQDITIIKEDIKDILKSKKY